MIEFNRVSKIYDNKIHAVSDVTFNVAEGEFIFLIGPSGSGKTTIIKMLIRDEVPTFGKVFFKDTDITRISRRRVYKLRREVGVIFQDFKLVNEKTAFENVSFAMEAAGKNNKEIKETVPYVLDIVGLADRMHAFPRQLSGGEQQRVAIARAIANNPKILIADEPTGNLDPASSWDIVQILTKINNWGTTVIMSTHGTDIVNSLNKRVVQMDKGKIVRDDNKGQYELANDFEEKMDKSTEKQEEYKEGKQKKTFILKIEKTTKDKSGDDSENQDSQGTEIDQPKRRGIFGILRRKNKPATQKIMDVLESKDKDEVEEKSKKRKLHEYLDDDEEAVETKNLLSDNTNNDNEAHEETEQLQSNNTDEDSEDTVESKKLSSHDTDKEDDEKPKTKHLKSDNEDNNHEENNNDDDKPRKVTPIKKLKLPKDLQKALKDVGYSTVEEIIEDGIEGLSEKLILEPEEVIIIAKEIKKYSDQD